MRTTLKVAAAAKSPTKTKPKKRHVPLDCNDPALTPQQRFEIRLHEARWRQRKRRNERRRQRKRRAAHAGRAVAGAAAAPPHGGVGPSPQQLAQQQLAQQQQRIVARLGGGGVGPSPAPPAGAGAPSAGGTEEHGPWQVEYVCAVCNEGYPSSSDLNPWWALSSHECPKCGKSQIPRLDITSPTNAIEYHPALLAHLDDNHSKIHPSMLSSIAESAYAHAAQQATAGMGLVPYQPQTQTTAVPNTGAGTMAQYNVTYNIAPRTVPTASSHLSNNASAAAVAGPGAVARTSFSLSDSEVSHTDESGGEGGNNQGKWNYDESSDEEETAVDAEDVDSVTREERAEREEFGFDYKGETLSDDQARRLLVLIEHASTCPGKHHSAKHRNVCHSTKYLMLHIRDCPGLLSNGEACPFPWCRKVKHLLYHLVSCKSGANNDGGGATCTICLPTKQELSPNLAALAGLNTYRRNKFKERVKAILAKRQQLTTAVAAAAKPKAQAPAGGCPSQQPKHRKLHPHPNELHTATLNPRAVAANIGVIGRTRTPLSSSEGAVAAAVHQHLQQPQPVQGQQQRVGPSSMIATTPNPAFAAVTASLSANNAQSVTTTVVQTPSHLHPHQLPSPSPPSTLTRGDPSLSTGTLPFLEEAVLEIGDITLSAADLLGPA